MSKISSLLNKLTDSVSGINSKFGSAIIVAAGSGTRASTDGTTKQMMPLLGIPVIARTIGIFESCKFIKEIIIVGKANELKIYDKFIKEYDWKKVTKIVAGGETRQTSVLEGFKCISDKSELVYIHDGARCLVTEKNIADVGRAACIHGAAFAAKKSSDTVRYEEGDKLKTVDRNRVWLAQTPQVFLTELYRASAYTALKNGFTATDDISLSEEAGFKSVPVDCGGQNIKITEPYDFAIAEAILAYRGRGDDKE